MKGLFHRHKNEEKASCCHGSCTPEAMSQGEAGKASGGVKVQEVDPKTMASKLVAGLYFAGEILDVDAYTGGFNLQIAWSTGYCAGTAAGKGR